MVSRTKLLVLEDEVRAIRQRYSMIPDDMFDIRILYLGSSDVAVDCNENFHDGVKRALIALGWQEEQFHCANMRQLALNYMMDKTDPYEALPEPFRPENNDFMLVDGLDGRTDTFFMMRAKLPKESIYSVSSDVQSRMSAMQNGFDACNPEDILLLAYDLYGQQTTALAKIAESKKAIPI